MTDEYRAEIWDTMSKRIVIHPRPKEIPPLPDFYHGIDTHEDSALTSEFLVGYICLPETWRPELLEIIETFNKEAFWCKTKMGLTAIAAPKPSGVSHTEIKLERLFTKLGLDRIRLIVKEEKQGDKELYVLYQQF